MIVYRIKAVAELTEDVIIKMSLTNTRATMEQIHSLWLLVLPSGEKERQEIQLDIQYVTCCREISPRSPVQGGLDCTSLTLTNFNEYLFDYLSYQIETFEYVNFFETIDRYFMCVCNHDFYSTESKVGFKMIAIRLFYLWSTKSFPTLMVRLYRKTTLRATSRTIIRK